MSFWGELKRRNVFRVGIAYLAAVWVLIQVADIVLPNFGAPGWVVQALIVAAAVGFPFAVVLAWFYDLTPEGIKATSEIGPAQSVRFTGRKIDFAIIGLLVLAVGFLVVDDGVLENSEAVPPNSIAVLPFLNFSPDPEQEYFADGLTEELLNKMAQIQGLRVTGRTSSFFFKGKNEDLREIGNMLGVANLLEGSVRKSGNEIRITAQLIKAQDGFHSWSETFDRELADIFAVQDEIADAVTTALSVTLGVGQYDRPGMTRNVDAYDAYLQGLTSYDRDDLNSIGETIEHFRQAVNLDPEFGLAWLRLQQAYSTGRVFLPAEESADFQQLGNEALERAGQAAPEMPELLVTRAEADRRNGRWLEAESLFLRVLNTSGNSNPDANYLYGHLLASVGRSRDALPYLERAKRLDPLSPDIPIQIARVLVSLGRFDQADAEADRGIALGNPRATLFLNSLKAMSAYSEGDLTRAASSIATLAGATPDDAFLELANLLADGNVDGTLARLRALVEDQTAGPVVNSGYSIFAAVAGDEHLTLRFLQKQSNANINDFFGSNPMWHSFYSDMRALPGFKELARQAGLVEYWRGTGQWGDFCAPVGDDDFQCH